MHTKRYLIIDDNPTDAEYLQGLLTLFTVYESVAVAATLEEALGILNTQHIDLIFLDVRLSGQSGLNLLRANVPLPPVIIVSAYAEYAIDSYEIGQATDYLLKPFSTERLQQALARALRLPTTHSPALPDTTGIFLKMGRRMQRFPYDSIEYVQAYGIYSKVHDHQQAHVVNERLIVMTEMLPSQYFMRVHKSYIINMNKITSYERYCFWLGKVKIPIGVSYLPRLKSLLGLFNTHEE